MKTTFTQKRVLVSAGFTFVFLVFLPFAGKAQLTGLSEWSIFLDPGHSQTENMGLYNYSEAQKVLRVALNLRDMLEQQTDIGSVHLCRLTDQDYISLTGRTDLANSLGVDFYYSIHSDAGSASANSTLVMYGGWRKDGVTLEKTPQGGAAMGGILTPNLTEAMRLSTRGLYADRVFYQGLVDTHENQWPYLHVNRTTNMASLLSEAGFHTNPTQQQRNMNAEWKKLEATAAFRSILEYHGIARPAIGVATGIITDEETGVPVNGVTVTIGDKQYTTDTYELLFNQYSNDPDQLHNGFYWIDGLTPGETVTVSFTSDSYQSKSVELPIVTKPEGTTGENLSFLDVTLINSVPPVVSGVEAEDRLDQVIPGHSLTITFSRKMDHASVESALTLSTGMAVTYNWINDFKVELIPQALEPGTVYSVTLDGAVAKNLLTNQFLDGDADGTEGGNYTFEFTTIPPDEIAPELVDFSPSATVATMDVRPIIRLVYDEEINPETIAADAVTVTPVGGGSAITGVVDHTVVEKQSVIHFFPTQDLASTGNYRVEIKAGLEDEFGNATELESFNFEIKEKQISEVTVIDNFNNGVSSWWQPTQSGSTTGVIGVETTQSSESEIVCETTESTGSMKLNYAWDMSASGKYIRLYLPPTSEQNSHTFGPQYVLQTCLFGDGSGTQFCFTIKDGSGKYEQSPWITIDWIGWKVVSWDLVNEAATGWVNGDGVLDGTTGYFLDGFHFRYNAFTKIKTAGTLYFDNLRFVLRDQNFVSVNDPEQPSANLFPNPVRNMLNVESPQVMNEVRVYDIAGRLVLVEKPRRNQTTINMSGLQAGWYVVKVVSDTGSFSSKIRVVD
jgi:N-acetylmuramoyl-L-alanine amidase